MRGRLVAVSGYGVRVPGFELCGQVGFRCRVSGLSIADFGLWILDLKSSVFKNYEFRDLGIECILPIVYQYPKS